MNSKDKLINDLLNLQEVKRIKALERKIDENEVINSKFLEMKNAQKQMVISKELGMENNYLLWQEKYDLLMNELLKYPFVEEYLDLLEEVNLMLKNVFNIISYEINEKKGAVKK